MNQAPKPPPMDDPFAEIGNSGRTFIMPTPGGRAGAAARQGAANPAAQITPVPQALPAADLEAPDSGLNPLLALANRLLALVPHIRGSYRMPDPAALRESIAAEVRSFEQAARQAAISSERIMAARYVLCTVLDEVAASTPWGGAGQWGQHSLLAMFHNETGGGDKVFQLMAKLAQEPASHRDLLELIYAALSLGFEGRLRVTEGGAAKLEAVRTQLAQIVRTQRGDYPSALAQNWRGVLPKRRPLLSWLPLAATAALCALLLVGVYLFMSVRLARQSDPVYSRILALKASPAAATKPAATQARLVPLLQAPIQAGQLTVRDEPDRSVLTVLGDGLFAPASDSISAQRQVLFAQVAAALAQVPGSVVVSGHTDNTPIGTARFPSNWHLSQARALAVRNVLVAAGVPAQRLRAEGRADGEPVAPNNTPTNRSFNRRVEVTLLSAVGPTAAEADRASAVGTAGAAGPATSPAKAPSGKTSTSTQPGASR